MCRVPGEDALLGVVTVFDGLGHFYCVHCGLPLPHSSVLKETVPREALTHNRESGPQN